MYVLVLLFCLQIVPFTYVTSFYFKKENNAQNATLMLHIFCGVILGIMCMIFRFFDETRDAGNALAWIFRFVPSFALADGIINLAK